eukprot:scaffold9688_cov60-Attheya_sp.AAC.11
MSEVSVKETGSDAVALVEEDHSSLSLLSITDGKNERDIPAVKFIEDIGAFSESFSPPASPELMIGAFSDMFSKYKAYETSLGQKRECQAIYSIIGLTLLFSIALVPNKGQSNVEMFFLLFLCLLLQEQCTFHIPSKNLLNVCRGAAPCANYKEKIPEIEKSLALVTFLKQKKDNEENIVTRYNLADTIYSKAEVDCKSGIVNLWLGANVMLEYTHEEAIDLLSSKEAIAKREFEEVTEDLAFTRNQIITSEVNISRIYNWDVRMKREKLGKEAAAGIVKK